MGDHGFHPAARQFIFLDQANPLTLPVAFAGLQFGIFLLQPVAQQDQLIQLGFQGE